MVDDFPISLEKAKEQRLELMEERRNLYAIHPPKEPPPPRSVLFPVCLVKHRANGFCSVIEQTEHMEENTFSVSHRIHFYTLLRKLSV